MRSFDRYDLWFAIILAALFIMAAVIFGPIFVGAAINPNFWITMAPILAISAARPALSKLSSFPRFLGWFCLGFVVTVIWMVVRGEPFNLLFAAGIGLMLGVVDFVTEYFRSRRKAAAD